MAIVKVRLKKGTYYYDLLPNNTFTKNTSAHPAGKIIPVLSKDAAELVTSGKAEYVKGDPKPQQQEEKAQPVPEAAEKTRSFRAKEK